MNQSQYLKTRNKQKTNGKWSDGITFHQMEKLQNEQFSQKLNFSCHLQMFQFIFNVIDS